MSDTQIWQLVAYVRSLQPGAARGGAASAVSGEPPQEKRCSRPCRVRSCHEVNARGGIVGPDLSNAGRLSPEVLRQKIVDPNAVPPRGRGGRGGATPATAIVKTRDGREIRGVRRNEDTFSLQMIDASGSAASARQASACSVRVENTSLMPGDYRTKLVDSEIDDLVAYLSTLRERDLGKIASTSQ